MRKKKTKEDCSYPHVGFLLFQQYE